MRMAAAIPAMIGPEIMGGGGAWPGVTPKARLRRKTDVAQAGFASPPGRHRAAHDGGGSAPRHPRRLSQPTYLLPGTRSPMGQTASQRPPFGVLSPCSVSGGMKTTSPGAR